MAKRKGLLYLGYNAIAKKFMALPKRVLDVVAAKDFDGEPYGATERFDDFSFEGIFDDEVEQFRFCCGASEIGNFEDLYGKELTQDEFNLAFAAEYMLKKMTSAAICTTTAGSPRRVVAALPVLGFKRLGSFRNANTRNIVTMWGFNIN